ncbi:molybdate ABC transporter substrate-binding protein [Alkalicoccus halolimnae]|uniref:Molybdate ABC transporter substrate-binding protein n=1 Tax=Alkalicoccus halolimnae TaxID=1667239 RepID=A0A5C7FL13_9BACI|nr:molybdate ABC transporter substrate-binding protein [Alkalicoccus halolimnae]TXF86769.1 molybdate ABC transporter substrate-binding protein [Alkalicoccus halolimnae]
MINRSSCFIIPFIVLYVLLSSGCSASESKENEEAEITVAAASSLSPAFTELGPLFEEESGTAITFSFGSTGQLTEQIENGAPFDVFASADIAAVDQLRENELIVPDTQTTYAFGRIGLSTLPETTETVETLEDLLKPEVKKIAIANPDHAPYGKASKQALENEGLWEELEEKIIYGRNITDTLSFIETGNAEAGIIALSLYDEEELNFHMIDEDLHAPLEKSIAVIEDTSEEEAAKAFIDFIQGPTARPIMESHGFTVPEGD